MNKIIELKLFNEDELNAMVSNSNEIVSDRVTDNLGILHHGLCQNLNFTSSFQMPIVKPILCDIPKHIIAYYRTTTGKYSNAVPHFYTDDKHLEGLWTRPNKYARMILSRNTLIIGPDFSVYAELVFTQKLWNIFRNKLLVAWWQYNGIDVIPNISWINENYECSFDGWPQGSVIAVNSTGVGNSERCKAMWITGYKKMLEYLNPAHIIRYGAKQIGENDTISTYYPNDNLIMARYGW